MPKNSGSFVSKRVVEKKKCNKCLQDKYPDRDYYVSFSKMHGDSRVPVCKLCLSEMFDANNVNDSLKTILKLIDKPYLCDVLQSSIEENPSNIFGTYMKNIGMRQYKGFTWKNSVFEKEKITSDVELEKDSLDLDFKVTQEILHRWGQNYEVDDYIKLEDFYRNMKKMNKIETPQEETYLKKLAVISVKMDQELEAGNYGQVKQLGDLFSKYMADSKFRAMDKSEADKTGGIRSFGAIFAEVESDGHIPPWEEYRKLKGITQDLVDRTIMHIENFTLRLNKIERMAEPPSDTPKISEGDV